MNEATGEVFDTAPRAGTNGHEVDVYVEAIADPTSPGGFDQTNRIRFALFDSYGNESMVRVRLDGIPLAGSCPLP